ncbi:hypothetical protein Q9L58_004828 [Maublancomyces gigas]|uniref:Tho complex subunit 7 n=1 Tax=Discina gigas TaxID=1032678 RepID=A0ABR3GJN7_9PEZI
MSSVPTRASAQRLREEIDLDFKFFEGVVARIQLLKDTNRREVERYDKEKGDILETASTARSTLIALRESLTLSQQEKENKLIYDVIATDILSNRALKPRAEQHVNLDRLNKEIADLEAEREEYRTVWAARRAQFGQIVDQLEKMWAQIKEDKDEQDRREGMSEEEEGEEVENPARSTTPFLPSSSGATPKPAQSHLDTTVPMDAATPGVSTPIPVITHTSPEQEMEEGEEAEVEEGEAQEGEQEDGADMEIVDAQVTRKQSGKEEEREEGEEEEGDKMDVT